MQDWTNHPIHLGDPVEVPQGCGLAPVGGGTIVGLDPDNYLVTVRYGAPPERAGEEWGVLPCDVLVMAGATS